MNAYINLFELWLVDGDEFDEAKIKQFLEYAKDNKQSLLKYEMIMCVKESLGVEQASKIAELKERFADMDFGSWSWNVLEAWAEKIIDKAARDRVKTTIEAFKNWKKA